MKARARPYCRELQTWVMLQARPYCRELQAWAMLQARPCCRELGILVQFLINELGHFITNSGRFFNSTQFAKTWFLIFCAKCLKLGKFKIKYVLQLKYILIRFIMEANKCEVGKLWGK